MAHKFLLLLLLCFTSLRAQTDSMLVEQKDGTRRTYAVSQIREISFSQLQARISTGEKKMMEQVLTSFAVHQNFPNPFNPTTTIQYTIPQKGAVTVSVFDAQGRLVRSLEAGVREAGNHSTVWDARNNAGAGVASGVYYCQVLFNQRSIVKKLLFLK